MPFWNSPSPERATGSNKVALKDEVRWRASRSGELHLGSAVLFPQVVAHQPFPASHFAHGLVGGVPTLVIPQGLDCVFDELRLAHRRVHSLEKVLELAVHDLVAPGLEELHGEPHGRR